DTVHGKLPGKDRVKAEGNALCIGSQRIEVTSEKDPAALPWKKLGIDYVVESTGRFTHLEDARKHVAAGAKRVLITAPGKDGVPTYVVGVNHHLYDPKKEDVICNASCTTNCLAPLCKVLLEHFGIEEGLMSTVHSLTA